jgi:hypothetical protein
MVTLDLPLPITKSEVVNSASEINDDDPGDFKAVLEP